MLREEVKATRIEKRREVKTSADIGEWKEEEALAALQ